MLCLFVIKLHESKSETDTNNDPHKILLRKALGLSPKTSDYDVDTNPDLMRDKLSKNGRDVWALAVAVVLVLTMWKKHSKFLALCLTCIVMYQAYKEEDNETTMLRVSSGFVLAIILLLFTNGKEVIMKFTSPDLLNLPMWMLPFLVVLSTSLDSLYTLRTFHRINY